MSVAVGGPQLPLRVDVWGHPHPPRVLVQRFARVRRDVVVELSMRRKLWMPLSGSSPEMARFMRGYAESIGTRLLDEGANIGVESIVDRVAADPTLIALADHAWPLPVGAPIRRVPIRPAPLYPWYAVRRVHGHPLAVQLIASTKQDTSFVRVPEEHWLPTTAPLDQNASSATPL